MVDMKTKLESAAGLIKGFEESKKKMQRDLEVLQMRSEQLLAENNKVNTFNKKLLSKVRSLVVPPTSVKFYIHIQEDGIQWLNCIYLLEPGCILFL